LKVLVQGGEIQNALTVVQSLGRNGVDVVVGAKNKKTISYYSKYCTKHFQYPCPKNNSDDFIQCMITEVKKEQYDILLSMGGDGMLELSKHRDLFLPYVKIPLVDHNTLLNASNKAETLKFALENHIPCPKTYFVNNDEDVKKIEDELTFPVIMKPTNGAGSQGLEYITRREELIKTYEKTKKKYGDMIIQELIPPGGDAFGFEGLFNKKSEPRAVFVHKRLREFPITGGPSTFRVSVNNQEIEELGTRLLRALGWYGIAMVEFKVDPRDNTPKLMEINPRFWGSLPLSIASGVDFPFLLCKMAIDGDITPVPDYKMGVKARSLFYEDFKYLFAVMKGLKTPWGYHSPGRLKTLREFITLYEKNLVYDNLSWDDPVPGILRIISPLFRPYT
jgi:predicted ATP-grasp superfamily ATP-dependent carboligase